MLIVMNPARIASSVEILQMLWFVIRLIFKTSSYHSLPAVKVLTKSVCGKFWARTSLILCFTICVHSGTRHNIHMYPYFLFAEIHHLNRPRLSLSDLVAQSAE